MLRFLRLAHSHAAVLCLSGVDRVLRYTHFPRATSSALRPASSCFSAPIIYASVACFDRPSSHSFRTNHTQLWAETGEQVKLRYISFFGVSFQRLNASDFKTLKREDPVNPLKIARNILGTAGLIFVGYVLIASLKDSWRYAKISSM